MLANPMVVPSHVTGAASAVSVSPVIGQIELWMPFFGNTCAAANVARFARGSAANCSALADELKRTCHCPK